MILEGILIHKVSYKERDLIAKLLLRNGMSGSFYIYGGQGGGKKHKPTIFETGAMIRILIKDQKAKVDSAELMIAAESTRLWSPREVRHDIKAFYLVCMYFELVQKFLVPFKLGSSEYESQDHEGIFSVVSNALFYVDEALIKKQFSPHQHLTLFMVKLLYHLGIMPETQTCSYCQSNLSLIESVVFLPAGGQFACQGCQTGDNEKGFLLRIRKGYQTRFEDYLEFHGTNFTECDKLIQYFCHHYQLRPIELKSYGLLFK